MFLSTAIPKPSVHFLPAMSCKTIIGSSFTNSLLLCPLKHTCIYKHPTCFAFSRESKLQPNHDHNLQPKARSRNKKTKIIKKEVEDPDSICKSNSETGFDYNPNVESQHKARIQNNKTKVVQKKVEDPDSLFPPIIPKKPRRGRKSEAAAVEDFVRESLERTFASIKQQNPEIFKDKKSPMKDRVDDEIDSDGSDEDEDDVIREKEMVVEEENPNWPLDADVGWGIRASEYFDQHPIKNVVGEDGVEIDWEGEIDDNWVKEINCLEWESIAFHPSPLIVLVFERYNRATDNWKVLKELEKAAKVYWSAKDRLPPRTVKIDINIEKDLAYALKVKECPQILFLRGNRILYRETKTRTADELVHMIAHFYYNAKQPSWISEEI